MDEFVNYKTFYPINRKLTENEFKNLRILCVFGCGKSCIYVTNEDTVYGFGYNEFGCLGLGLNDEYIDSPKLNPTLTGKHLIDLSFSYGHCLGLTRTGQCYSWGGNEFGQLGTGIAHTSPTPQLIQELANKRVIRISSGNAHNLALTDSGQVYGWGRNHMGECGNKCVPNCFRPTLIEFETKVMDISCGKTHSIALMSSGLVYVWGNNKFGQLGRKPIIDEKTQKVLSCKRPLRMDTLAKHVVIKAVCGPNHTLLLTTSGDIYAFGNNDRGQVGNGHKGIQYVPVRVNDDIKFKDIATSFKFDTSVGLSVANTYYVWGLCDKKDVIRPQKMTAIDVQSMVDIFAIYSERRITYRAVVHICEEEDNTSDQTIHCLEDNGSENLMDSPIKNLDNCSKPSNDIQMIASNVSLTSNLIKSASNLSLSDESDNSDVYYSSDESPIASNLNSNHKKVSETQFKRSNQSLNSDSNALLNRLIASFNNPFDYDILFRLEDQYIYGHKTILRLRNEKFWQKCEKHLNKNNNEIRIDCYSYKAFLSFIQYLYTNSFKSEDIESAAQLLCLANTYGEEELKDKCRQLLLQNIDSTNVCQIYGIAMSKKISELEKYCLEFVAKNKKQIFLNQEFRDMNDSMAKRMIIGSFKWETNG